MKQRHLKTTIIFLLACRLGLFTQMDYAQNAEKYNILFIAADDLNVDLGCYGDIHLQLSR